MAYSSNGYSGDERDLDGGDKPCYMVEHLATFTVTEETNILTPSDGMRRLLQLEKTNGIWSQKMKLCLEKSWVLIKDYETGSEMEKFSRKSIEEPTAFTSNDPMEMYNNILAFIVTNSNPAHPPEMHIFQCQSISAQDLVEDLKNLKMGRSLGKNRKHGVPPPPSQVRANQIIPSSRDYRESDSELTANNDDNSSTTSEQYERDVTVLNHCFDDIEKFIARLQHAAAASRELERRRKSRKSKKRDNGDGMLTMRTKPPSEKEFFDIFQKFKLSFNLLAKLKAHIHDPNAPELVHFLFTPLALIVEASHDTYYEMHLPHKVISPLLTREAINLLINCVTSKETELWHSLGNAWLIPRDEWKGSVPSYHPVFLDKWSPDYPVVDELESDGKHFRDSAGGLYTSDYNDYEPSNQDYMYERNNDNLHHDPREKLDHDRELDPSTRSDISADSIERNDDRSFKRSQDRWLDLLHKKNALVVQVTYPRTANNEKELTVVRGEYLEILDDSRKWWKARNQKGEVAHVPHTIVTKINYLPSSPDIYNNPLYSHYHRNKQDPSDRYDPQSSSANDHPTQPIIPVAPAERVRKERLDSPIVPTPPPPPPENVITPVTPKSTLKRSNSIKSAAPVDMQDELNVVLAMFREKKRQDIDIKTYPEVYINQKSNPSEVQNWLKAKEFSTSVCHKLKSFSGHELLRLTKNQTESIGGSQEGKRLFSQINVQKSVCGYQTMKSSELRAILAKAREKIEENDF